MTVQYIDGFDHYASATGTGNRVYEKAPNLWNMAGSGATNHADTNTMPVLGSRGLRCQWAPISHPAAGESFPKLALPTAIASGQVLHVGFHFYMNAISALPSGGGLFGFCGTSTASTRTLRINSNGTLSWCRGAPLATATQDATSSSALVAGVLYHLEARIYFHASAGTLDVRINGVPFMSATGLNTMPTDLTHIGFAVNGRNVSSILDVNEIYYDNLYLSNELGAVNNGWIGERTVFLLMPNADTGTAAWTKSTGVNGYDLINDVPSNDGSNYLQSTAVGDESVFDLSNLASLGIIPLAVQSFFRGQKTAAGTCTVKIGVRSGASTSTSPDQTMVQNQFQMFQFITELNPATSAPFNATEINGLQLYLRHET